MFQLRPLFFSRTSPSGVLADLPVDIETQLLVQEAEKYSIQWEFLENTDVVKLSYQGQVNYFRNSIPSTTDIIAYKICRDKVSTSAFLRVQNVQVAKGMMVRATDSEDYLTQVWEAMPHPVVIKPTHGAHGDAVHIGVNSKEEYVSIIKQYFSKPLYEGGMVVEEMFHGKEYRIIATKEKVLAIMERIPAHIIGDGSHTIKELIEIENTNPIRNIAHDLYPHIAIDDDLIQNLSKQQLDVSSVPEKNAHITLRIVSNIMAGGTAVDRTDDAHPSVSEIAVRTVQAIPGLSWAGLDFMTQDLTAPQTAESYRIIEVNAGPGFSMHDMPMIGKSRGVATEFLKLLFPNLKN